MSWLRPLLGFHTCPPCNEEMASNPAKSYFATCRKPACDSCSSLHLHAGPLFRR